MSVKVLNAGTWKGALRRAPVATAQLLRRLIDIFDQYCPDSKDTKKDTKDAQPALVNKADADKVKASKGICSPPPSLSSLERG
jgi:hypothetical protein